MKDVLKAYALDSSEHLLPFALSSGSHSDPVVIPPILEIGRFSGV